MNRTSKQRLATVIKAVPSKISRWKIGEVVKAMRTGRRQFCIEKVKWKAPKVALCNQCAFVPADCLELHGKV